MKAVILAGGRGKRINDLTNGENKCLIKVKDRTILQNNIENISMQDEIEDIIIVVGYQAEKVMHEIGNEANNKPITYCIQKEQLGLINALESAKHSLKNKDFILLLGDELIINNQYEEAIRRFYYYDYNCIIGTYNVDDIDLVKKTYTIKINDNEQIEDLVEKPAQPFNNIMGTGNIIFKKGLVDYINQTPINPLRGERELVDFLKIILSDKGSISTFNVGDYYFNLNTLDDYKIMLKTFSSRKSKQHSEV